MRTSLRGVDFIAFWEGRRLLPYDDAAGRRTIGVGHLIRFGEDLERPITDAECDELLRADLATAEGLVNGNAHVPLHQSQFDALVSFTYNLGMRPSIFALLNAGNDLAVVDKMLEYRMAGGKPLKGLLRRRLAEAVLFLS